MSQQRDVIEQKQGPNQIVRIRSDSETNLDDLFKAVMQPNSRPMRQRNLPPSFFQQPERGSISASHSRESSTDNTFSNPPPQPNSISNTNNNNSVPSPVNLINNSTSPPPHPSGLPINHPRAHSSPASLQQTYNAAVQHQHIRQQSYDVSDNRPLPPGWEMARAPTGQKYYLNHRTQTTTWEDPRKKSSSSSLSSSSGVTCSSPSTSPATSLVNLGPLPDGWEQSLTSEGDMYFINHKDRTTSWFDPRLPPQMQKTPPVVPILSYVNQSHSILGLSAQQLQTSSVAAACITSSLSGLSNQLMQQQQQQLRLQNLQRERERYRLKNQELLKNANLASSNPLLNDYIRQSLHEESVVPSSSSNHSSDSTQSNPTNIDPFLGADADFHSRQESGDSGLGLSSNYSLPNTPENYLMGMDEGEDVLLDIADLNLESIPGGALDVVPENMDSDDLEPSLHVEGFSGDILSEMETLFKKESDMKWL